VQWVADANDLPALREAIANAQAETARPSLIVVRSHIGYGAPHAVDTAKAHGAPLGADEVRAAKEALGWDPDAKFVVPDEVREHCNRVERGIELEDEWQGRFERWSQAFPGEREEWDRVHEGRVGRWSPPDFEPGTELATREAGKKVMQAFKRAVPTMVGGAADLAESTYTEFEGGGLFSATWSGRNIAFGIREHAMGSIVNGIALHGGMVKPYGSTFLIFSDYMRPAVRLSALMELPVVWVWTHDSVGLGEDGPTHQPVETYAALRAIPHLWFVRPADATETAVAWQVALERPDGPVALSLSRQKVPTLDRTEVAAADGLRRGAYTLWESSGSPDLILIGTGTEVALALEAARRIADDGTHVRVVSMPCWELFELQDADYREQVLPPEVAARLSIEPGVVLGWKRWVGDRGDSMSIERFGASAPGTTVLEKLGFNVDSVVARATALLERVA
jgi:transketolase